LGSASSYLTLVALCARFWLLSIVSPCFLDAPLTVVLLCFCLALFVMLLVNLVLTVFSSAFFEMAASGYSLLKEVDEGSQKWKIRTRIARLWEHCDENKNGELVRLHMVLVDEKVIAFNFYVFFKLQLFCASCLY
jgi:hypothetical protein